MLYYYIVRGCLLVEFCDYFGVLYSVGVCTCTMHVIGCVSDCVLLRVVMCYYHLLCNLWVFCCIG